MRLKCQRCGHEWEYTGKNKFVAPCAHCKTSVSIRKNKQDLSPTDKKV